MKKTKVVNIINKHYDESKTSLDKATRDNILIRFDKLSKHLLRRIIEDQLSIGNINPLISAQSLLDSVSSTTLKTKENLKGTVNLEKDTNKFIMETDEHSTPHLTEKEFNGGVPFEMVDKKDLSISPLNIEPVEHICVNVCGVGVSIVTKNDTRYWKRINTIMTDTNSIKFLSDGITVTISKDVDGDYFLTRGNGSSNLPPLNIEVIIRDLLKTLLKHMNPSAQTIVILLRDLVLSTDGKIYIGLGDYFTEIKYYVDSKVITNGIHDDITSIIRSNIRAIYESLILTHRIILDDLDVVVNPTPKSILCR